MFTLQAGAHKRDIQMVQLHSGAAELRTEQLCLGLLVSICFCLTLLKAALQIPEG